MIIKLGICGGNTHCCRALFNEFSLYLSLFASGYVDAKYVWIQTADFGEEQLYSFTQNFKTVLRLWLYTRGIRRSLKRRIQKKILLVCFGSCIVGYARKPLQDVRLFTLQGYVCAIQISYLDGSFLVVTHSYLVHPFMAVN